MLVHKPIVWKSQEDTSLTSETITHKYILRFSNIENTYVLNYVEKSNNSVGLKHVKSINDATEFIMGVHLPSKLKEWFVSEPDH